MVPYLGVDASPREILHWPESKTDVATPTYRTQFRSEGELRLSSWPVEPKRSARRKMKASLRWVDTPIAPGLPLFAKYLKLFLANILITVYRSKQFAENCQNTGYIYSTFAISILIHSDITDT